MENQKSGKTFLNLMMEIFHITFSSESTNNKLSYDNSIQSLERIINSELKDVKTTNCLYIQNISDTQLDFSQAIKAELKYLLINFKTSFLLHNKRNYLIYLICQIIESINEEKIESKLFNVRYIVITSALFSDSEEKQKTILSFIFQLTVLYPKEAKSVFIKETYLKMIKEKKEKTVISTYEILLKLVKEVKNIFESQERTKQYKEAVEHLNKMYLWNELEDKSKEQLIDDTISFIRECKKKLKAKLNIQKYISLFDLFPFDGSYIENLQFIIKNIKECDWEELSFYSTSFSELLNQIQSILKQSSFREKVYDVFSSKVIQDYKQIQQLYMITNSKNKIIIMSEEIIEEYNKFCDELKNTSFRNNFFEKNICVGRLSKSIKAFTTRYLQIVINYSGIEKNIPSNNLSLTKNDFSKEDLALINKDKKDSVLNEDDISELISIQVLKSLLLLIIIHELNHYVRRSCCINEDIIYGEEEHMFKKIFGVKSFTKMNYQQAIMIYNKDNWNGELNKFIELFKENDDSKFPYVLKFMETKEKRARCVEGYQD